MALNTITAKGNIYTQVAHKLLNQTFATCTKKHWPQLAVANPSKMGDPDDDKNWFRTFALDCGDFE
jgi:hypothetical protein